MSPPQPLTRKKLAAIKHKAIALAKRSGFPSRRSLTYLMAQADLYPDAPALLHHVGIALAYAECDPKTDDAIESPTTYFKRALKVDPGYGPALEELGWYHEIRNRFGLGLRYFERALQTDQPGDAIAGIARIKAQQGARAAWEQGPGKDWSRRPLSKWGRCTANEILRGEWDLSPTPLRPPSPRKK